MLEKLEHDIDLRFAAETRLPFMYNNRAWPDGRHVWRDEPNFPLVGYTAGDEPPPSAVLVTLLTSMTEEVPLRWPLKALLLYSVDHGIDSAVLLLAALQREGFLQPSAGESLIDVLVRARQSVESDAEVVDRLLPGHENLKTVPEVTAADLNIEWLEYVRTGNAQRCTNFDISGLLEASLAQIEKLRSSRTLDEWLLGHSDVFSILQLVMHARGSAPKLSLGVEAILNQLEEIRADSGAFLFSLPWKYMRAGRLDIVSAMRSYETSFEMLPENIRVQAKRQRVVRPDAISFLDSNDHRLPPTEWREVSPKLIAPLMCAYPELHIFENLPRDPGITDEAEYRHLLTAVKDATGDGQYGKAIQSCRDGLDAYPWSAQLRAELSNALDRAGQLDQALAKLIEAISINPLVVPLWQSLLALLLRRQADEEAEIARGIKMLFD
jgi:tetratricopeptide (TPR) repeat protein